MWVPIVFYSLVIGYVARSVFLERHRRIEAWQKAAATCGLRVTEISSSGWNPKLKTRAGPLEVWIGTTGDKAQATRLTRLEVWVSRPPDFHKVSLHLESRWAREDEIGDEPSVHGAREIETGDESFDRKFFLEGPPQLVLALLDADTRRLLVRVQAESRLEVSVGVLRADMSDKEVPDLLPLLLDIGRRFTQVDVPRRLGSNANRDPETRVRLQNLLLLIREFSGEPETVETLRAACSDPSPEIRLRAAKELGAEGRDVLLELAQSLDDDALSAEAVSVLDRELPLERAKALLDRAWSTGRLQTALACVEVLGHSGAAAVGLLAEVLALQNAELAAAAARALAETGSPDAERSLTQALEHDDADVRVAAAEALGRVGSAAAVLPLKEAAERSRLDRGLRQATRQAIAEIQARAEGASPGQLSLAGADAGQLSLAEDPAGQLSLGGDENPDARTPARS